MVTLTPGSVEPADIDLPALGAALASAGPGSNYLRNGNMALWTRGSTATACLVGTLTYRADWWATFPEYVAPGSATMTCERESSGPSNNKSLRCIKLTGAATIAAVDFCQDIPAVIGAALRSNLTFQFWIYNGTGAALTPLVRIDTADAADVFTAVTNRYSAAAGAAQTNATWAQYTHTVDATALANMTNGLRVSIRIPSGALDSGAKFVRLDQLKLEIGTSAGAFAVERDEVAEATASAATALQRNYLDNGGFAGPRWLTTSLTCTLGSDNYAAQSWWCAPAGASTLVMSRETASPDSVTLHCVKLLGGAGVNTVDFGQNVENHVTGMTRRQLTVSLYVYNGTGSAFVPTLRVDTCDGAHAFSTVTNRLSSALDSCPNGAWTRLSLPLNGADYTNWINGARISIRIPSGSLDGVGKFVRIAQAQLVLGTAALTFDPEPELTPEVAPLGAARSLVIRSVTTSTLSITADEILLKSASGRARAVAFSPAITVDMAVAGAGGLDTGAEAASTWYYIWAIAAAPASAMGLLSLSASAPTLPAGFNYKALVGVVRNDSGSNFIAFVQNARRVITPPTLVFTAKAPAVLKVYESVRTPATAGVLEGIIPPTAVAVRGNLGLSASASALFAIAANSAGLGETICLSSSDALNFSSFYNPSAFSVDLSTPQDFHWKVDSISAQNRMEITGYTI